MTTQPRTLIVIATLAGLAISLGVRTTDVCPDDQVDISGLPTRALAPHLAAAPAQARALVHIAAADEDAAPRAAWRDGELLVTGRHGVDLARVARDHGLSLRRAVGPSGLAAVTVPAGADLDALRSALLDDSRVLAVDRMGATYGAGRGGHHGHGHDDDDDDDGTPDLASLQWHADAISTPAAGSIDLSSYVVAVLDTGVAYEDYTDDSGTYAVAPGLTDVRFVAAYDFVNADDHANDDHQHGTHIASLIASQGELAGAASGVGVMPLKVLDASNQGSEVDLIDAIIHAVDNGADVINMSLAFSEGYSPSLAMREALQYAEDAGVVMVAAAGNDGEQVAVYPAAAPQVISVGATVRDRHDDLDPASYSNYGPSIDVMAPGGDLSADRDGDGYPDGVLAETIDPDDFDSFGYWLYAGTSQSAALASAAAVFAIDAGAATPTEVAFALQTGADSGRHDDAFLDGYGAGTLNITESIDAAPTMGDDYAGSTVAYVAVLPYLAASGRGAKNVRLSAIVTALDADGEPLADVTVAGSMWGSAGYDSDSCVTDSDGVCELAGAKVRATSDDGAISFGLAIDALLPEGGDVAVRPGAALFLTDPLVVVADALEAEGLLSTTLLAWEFEAGTDDDLGRIANAYTVVDAGSSARSRPLGIVFTPEVIEDYATVEELDLDLDGTGLFSDTLGFLPIRVVTIEGTGLFSDTLGFTTIKLAVFEGAGLFSDTLGFGAFDVYTQTGWTFEGAGLFSDTLGFSGQPLLLGGSPVLDSDISGTSLGSLIEDGGWMTEGGYLGASGLVMSGATGRGAADATVTAGALASARLDD